MKNLIFAILIFLYGCNILSINDDDGNINSTCEVINLIDTIPGIVYPKDSMFIIKFLKDSLKISSNDEFRFERLAPTNHFFYKQYYKNVQVELGNVSLYFFSEGVQVLARYYRIKNLKVNPEITPDEALNTFKAGLKYPADSTSKYSTKLILKNCINPAPVIYGTMEYDIPRLVYVVTRQINPPFYFDEYFGNVDAITGKLIGIQFFPYLLK